ncbi:Rnh70p NDAI_0B00690 [Naumovozyma dairenensis CBS 421]|uniref:Exonuclease domain-containing protein n=1 Tax=Naumovozyma dairenensis (strain ATCC 10597 / BCRC 20456 / CBS 421 / NBRC 0211 / NRRL Y-12639) TaxID=1071378 RepID=G0W5P2_NAUDC|nr:hypothetical protein NDAI_0B00690 [Naumovozyma dairenensis CBS 421]CCD23103.1 hypothetical protein NDAI_0B00690 [Naumovozyma dairenensis CBS 421]
MTDSINNELPLNETLVAVESTDVITANIIDETVTKKRKRTAADSNKDMNDDNITQKNKKLKKNKKNKKLSKPITITIDESRFSNPTKKISLKDLRDLSLFVLNNTNNIPDWIQINNRGAINKLVVLFTPGLQGEDYSFSEGTRFHKEFITLRKEKSDKIPLHNFKYLENYPNFAIPNNSIQSFPVIGPGSKLTIYSPYNAYINVGLTKNEKLEKREMLAKRKITIHDLLMTLDELLESDYPIHPNTKGIINNSDNYKEIIALPSQDWIDTKPFDHDGSHTFALDCEMCLSENDGLVLTRISVLDFDMKVIYDTYVKPDVPIVDYLTKFSGITKEILDPVTTTLKDVQNDLMKIISSDDILVGHSLQSDLKVMKLRHPRIIDTAIIFNHKAGPPFKPALRYLASTYLNINIQEGNSNVLGHDSIEDARTCMQLLKLKLVNGLTFGISINTENIFDRLYEKNGVKSCILNDSVISTLSNKGDNQYKKRIRCNNDQEIFDSILENVETTDFIVARLRDLEFIRGYSQRSKISEINFESELSNENEILSNMGEYIDKIYEKAPEGTMILLISGSGDTRPWAAMMKELNALTGEKKNELKRELEKEIEESVHIARDGVASIIIKQPVVAKRNTD